MNFLQNIVNTGSSFISGLSVYSERAQGGFSRNDYSNDEPGSGYIPSESAVQSVRLHLLDYLPLELVDIVIEYAEYWPCIHAEESTHVHAIASQYPNHSARWCYLLSPPIPGFVNPEGEDMDGVRFSKVRRVDFEIESHDQGWGGEPADRGTFNGSWTWFEAYVVRSSDENMPQWLRDASEGPVDLGSLSSRDPSVNDSWDSVLVGPSTKRWHIQSNKTATRMKQVHSVVWTDEADEDASPEENSWKGRLGPGMGHELVRLLQPGDRVAIVARAQFPGWINHIFSASITIYYSV